MTTAPIPIILDTDIGSDIDDTWALAMLLKSPELDVKVIASATGDTDYRARIVAKFLERCGRTEIPVGIGMPTGMDPHRYRQRAWIEDYSLEDYPGTLLADGILAIIDTIMSSPVPVTIIAIGPVSNIAEALRREPAITGNAIFVGMQGSFNVHHVTNHHLNVAEGQIPEFNVACDIPAAQAVFRAPWIQTVLTPLDSCSMIVLDGELYQRLRKSSDRMVRMIMENYDIWSPWDETNNPDVHSSVLFDTVAVYLAFTTDGLRMERQGMVVDDQGYTRLSPSGMPVDIGMGWNDLNGYLNWLTNRLMG